MGTCRTMLDMCQPPSLGVTLLFQIGSYCCGWINVSLSILFQNVFLSCDERVLEEGLENIHMLHMYSFSPLCWRLWVFKLLPCDDVLSYSLHLKRNPVWHFWLTLRKTWPKAAQFLFLLNTQKDIKYPNTSDCIYMKFTKQKMNWNWIYVVLVVGRSDLIWEKPDIAIGTVSCPPLTISCWTDTLLTLEWNGDNKQTNSELQQMTDERQLKAEKKWIQKGPIWAILVQSRVQSVLLTRDNMVMLGSRRRWRWISASL